MRVKITEEYQGHRFRFDGRVVSIENHHCVR